MEPSNLDLDMQFSALALSPEDNTAIQRGSHNETSDSLNIGTANKDGGDASKKKKKVKQFYSRYVPTAMNMQVPPPFLRTGDRGPYHSMPMVPHLWPGVMLVDEQLSDTNLYIRGLSPDVTDESLRTMCASYGEIVSCKAILTSEPVTCRGYGFVMFATPEIASTALRGLQALSATTLPGSSPLIISYARLSARQVDPTIAVNTVSEDPFNLYFKNLPPDYDEEKLKNLLQGYGEVQSTLVSQDSVTHLNRGYGFARMSSLQQCTSVIKAMNGSVLVIGGEPLVCKFADSPKAKFQKRPPKAWRPNQFSPLLYQNGLAMPPAYQNGAAMGLNLGPHRTALGMGVIQRPGVGQLMHQGFNGVPPFPSNMPNMYGMPATNSLYIPDMYPGPGNKYGTSPVLHQAGGSIPSVSPRAQKNRWIHSLA